MVTIYEAICHSRRRYRGLLLEGGDARIMAGSGNVVQVGYLEVMLESTRDLDSRSMMHDGDFPTVATNFERTTHFCSTTCIIIIPVSCSLSETTGPIDLSPQARCSTCHARDQNKRVLDIRIRSHRDEGKEGLEA